MSTRLEQSILDRILTAQIAIAWAGEQGADNPRMGWWRTQLDEEFVGHDLFRDLLPRTGQWAALVAVRRAARVVDDTMRRKARDSDDVLTLYHFGFELGELLDDRLGPWSRRRTLVRDLLRRNDLEGGPSRAMGGRLVHTRKFSAA